ncbi:hypothetical protein MXE81_10770 [Mammaliicoccus sciuri]|uniref:DUF2975 domain-containing protein n=2 Tax=Mammaliicoccus sciuri TaxID=1296 RepID=A0ABT7HX11_MAMSC|nr:MULTISPECIES: hypothetical protein [Mammaliicoccus]OOV39001.1 hypothetical protein BS756_03230 [Staphylococcus sp. MB371]HCW34522.1 hypothetical protein [Staphylococcus sp.]MBO3079579.1 hypothetical protein [Mammaliicoccus sciuri]MCD3219098.1 hypothetical protein [Mammaliicoccus sciuri]MCD8779003.1 hypothetical protein [Mammaliicoccus sciuri]
MSNISNTEKRSYLITLIAMIIHALLVVVNLVVFFRKVPLSTAFDIKSGVLYYMICFIIQALLLIAFFIFVLSFIKNINKKDFFNSGNYNKIFFSSIIIMVYGTLNSMKSLIGVDVTYKELLSTTPYTTVLLLSISLMMLNFLTIYNESESMKEEHDLTV